MEVDQFCVFRKGAVPLELVEHVFNVRLEGYGDEDRAPSHRNCPEAVKDCPSQTAAVSAQTIEDLDNHSVVRVHVNTRIFHGFHPIDSTMK